MTHAKTSSVYEHAAMKSEDRRESQRIKVALYTANTQALDARPLLRCIIQNTYSTLLPKFQKSSATSDVSRAKLRVSLLLYKMLTEYIYSLNRGAPCVSLRNMVIISRRGSSSPSSSTVRKDPRQEFVSWGMLSGRDQGSKYDGGRVYLADDGHDEYHRPGGSSRSGICSSMLWAPPP
ncbi:hypothetical protein AJ80_00243 [Polytolypa hystricis UAMH7299]|uniref:Uncharacterized protein n=1 Tax=Polytolypa hystricis (strain UAMH7299) TaxID=1447883 RepID=A0A2B7Z4D4_POLH7|nr:hypothetical protein AJ80_00243 [Polytolypa hystricis UAMH7299]